MRNYLFAIKALLVNMMESVLPAPKEERKSMPLKLDLQFFADGDDDDDDLDDDDDKGDDLDLKELLKNPAFKKQYNAELKTHLGKRLKKYEGIDPEEYKRLKELAEKKKGEKSEEDDDEKEDLRSKLSAKEERLAKALNREKRAMVKEFAADNGYDAKLLSRLMKTDDIEIDDDGEPTNLEELFEEIEEEFPEYFGAAADEEEKETKSAKKSRYNPGSNQKTNKPDKSDKGKAAMNERYKKLQAKKKVKKD